MGSAGQARRTLIARMSVWLARYRGWALGTLGVLATITFILAQVLPDVGDFLVKRGLIPYLTLLVVLDIAVSLHMQPVSVATRFVRHQDEAIPALEDAAPHCRREGVDLLEYAGQTILPLVRTLHREGVPIRMLVQHPECVEGMQRGRNLTTLDTLFNSIFVDSEVKLEVRCYRAPYGLRGRRLGKNLLELGWLTPDLERKTTHGHDNPSVLADLTLKENEFLQSFFARTFDDLWKAQSTEDARAVLSRFQRTGRARKGG